MLGVNIIEIRIKQSSIRCCSMIKPWATDYHNITFLVGKLRVRFKKYIIMKNKINLYENTKQKWKNLSVF